MPVTPPAFLFALVCLTAAALLVQHVARRLQRKRWQLLALEAQLHYSPSDRLRLTDRVAAAFPVPGAAQVRLRDLLYCSDGRCHQYLFTVQYTIGTMRSRKRRQVVATWSEARDRDQRDPHRSPTGGQSIHPALCLADDQLSLFDQARSLIRRGAITHSAEIENSGETPNATQDSKTR